MTEILYTIDMSYDRDNDFMCHRPRTTTQEQSLSEEGGARSVEGEALPQPDEVVHPGQVAVLAIAHHLRNARPRKVE